MSSVAKFIGKSLFFLALMANLFLGVLFLSPVSFLVSLGYGEVNALQKTAIPEPVADFILTNKVPLPLTREEPIGFFRQLVTKILDIRSQRFMEDDEAMTLRLSILDYGEGVIGLEEASNYYFNRPLAQMAEKDWVMLVNWHQIFLR